MKKNNKGQLAIIDLVFALTLIIFALFLLFKISEISIYDSISKSNAQEINHIGNRVYTSLISSPLISCYIKDSNNSFILSKCISSDSNLTKENLGVPSNYNCDISGTALTNNECTDALPADTKNMYVKSTNILTRTNRDINKTKYINKLNENNIMTLFTEDTITLKVWRS